MRAFPPSPFLPRLALTGLAAGFLGLAAAPALAQSAACDEGGKIMNDRRNLVQQLSSLGKKKVDPRAACSLFGKLVGNGNAAIKWMDANKEWCSIPDNFVDGMKADHGKAVDLRGKACAAAAQMTAMEKKARAGQQNGGGGLLGGPGLTGEYKIPQGAL